MDWKIELIAIPVTDIDRAKDFYTKIGFHLDQDNALGDLRFVQLTPPGSACSICIGRGMPQGEPGSVRGIHIVVASAQHAYRKLLDAGVDVKPVEEFSWGKFVYFADPDGNQWAVQELPIK